MRTLLRVLVIFAIAVPTVFSTAHAAELAVLCSAGMRSVLDEVAPDFEKKTGHKLVVTYGLTVALKRQIDAGSAFDVAILTPGVITELVKESKIHGESRANVARSGIGLAVRQGTPKPDLKSVEDLKRALLEASSITYAAEGPSGAHLGRVIEQLGISEAVKPKLRPTTGSVAQFLAKGGADMAVQLVSELVNVSGIELVGLFPPELQNYVVLTAATSSSTRERGAAEALIRYLTAPAVIPVIRAKGMEPSWETR